MTDTLTVATMRTYTRASCDLEQTVTVNIDRDGRVRMTATNLHDVLTQLGFVPTKEP